MTIGTWILILFAHVGAMGDGNSNALNSTEFSTKERCVAAGQAAKKMTQGTVKSIEFVCVQR